MSLLDNEQEKDPLAKDKKDYMSMAKHIIVMVVIFYGAYWLLKTYTY